MAGSTIEARLSRLRPGPTGAAVAGLALLAEGFLVLAYLALGNRFHPNLLYPFIWMDVAVVAVVTAPAPPTTARRHRLGIAAGVGYFVVLGYFGGLWGLGAGPTALAVHLGLPPGYGPAIVLNGPLHLILEPYKIVGYLALAYLVYGTVIEAAGAAVSGVVGLFSCVSCSWPIIATVASSLFGGSSAIAAVAVGRALGLSTVVFVSAVLLLWWRPSL